MRLRTYESFWLIKNGLLYSYPSLNQNLQSEIVVIGGGITGALISHALIKSGQKVLLLDSRDIGQGSTSATTSMLQYEIDVPLYKLSKMIGEHAAAACYKAGIDAIKDLEKLIEEEEIDCGFQAKKSLYVAHNRHAAKWLKKEFEIRNKCHLGVQWLNENAVSEIYGLKTHGGILSETAASIDAYKLAHELIHKNTKRGLTVYDQTEIKKFEYKDDGVKIILNNGFFVSCKKIIFCSGFETLNIIKEKVADLFSTFACVSEQNIELPKKIDDILIWDTNNPYLYLRTTDDGRLLIGGEDSSRNSGMYRQRLKENKSRKLMNKLDKLMPGISFVEDFNWAGVFGSTKDGLPYIGKHPKFKNALFVLGFGGNGITFSIQGMQLIIDLMEGKENELLHYYRFGRYPPNFPFNLHFADSVAKTVFGRSITMFINFCYIYKIGFAINSYSKIAALLQQKSIDIKNSVRSK